MKILMFIASTGMLLASVSSQQQFYGAPVGAQPSSSFNSADPLSGLNLAQLLSLVGGQGGNSQQSYGVPQQQQQQFSAPIPAPQVAYIGPQQSQQQQFRSAAPVQQQQYSAPVQRFQAQPSSQYGSPSQYQQPQQQQFRSNQYNAPAPVFQQQQQFSSSARSVSSQYGLPQQQQQQFSGSARSLSSSYGAPQQQQQQQQQQQSQQQLSSQYGLPSVQSSSSVSNQYGVPNGAQASRNAQNGGYSSNGLNSNNNNGGYSNGQSQRSNSNGGYSNNGAGNGNGLGSVLNAVVSNGYSNTGSGNGLNDFSGNGGNGGNGNGNGNNGGALEQRIHKHVYIHVAPPEANEERPAPKRPSAPRIPEKHYKILFIKAPAPPTQAPIDLNDLVTPAPEQKTLVYVLLKKPDAAPEIRLPEAAPTKPSKPEVYFIRYKTNTENGGAAGQGLDNGNGNGNNNNNGINNGVNNGDLSSQYGAPSVSSAQGQPLNSVQSSSVPSNTYGPPGLRQVGPPGSNGGYNN